MSPSLIHKLLPRFNRCFHVSRSSARIFRSSPTDQGIDRSAVSTYYLKQLARKTLVLRRSNGGAFTSQQNMKVESPHLRGQGQQTMLQQGHLNVYFDKRLFTNVQCRADPTLSGERFAHSWRFVWSRWTTEEDSGCMRPYNSTVQSDSIETENETGSWDIMRPTNRRSQNRAFQRLQYVHKTPL